MVFIIRRVSGLKIIDGATDIAVNTLREVDVILFLVDDAAGGAQRKMKKFIFVQRKPRAKFLY